MVCGGRAGFKPLLCNPRAHVLSVSTLGCPRRYGFLGVVGTPVCWGSSTKTRVHPSSGHADGIASESSTHHVERCPAGLGPDPRDPRARPHHTRGGSLCSKPQTKKSGYASSSCKELSDSGSLPPTQLSQLALKVSLVTTDDRGGL